ncbi:VOC family protein [Austwickia chelonae]|uniref:VOC family protein n=1 Tax=Austwickia chelonae TaxID=100225 RepID=UPI000E22A5FF|nr:VOC family protein [Austwickia chelonae]
MPRINLTSIYVDDQERALYFYTEILGFLKKDDLPLGEHRWLTLVSPEEPHGVELCLEPDSHPAARSFKAALLSDGIPFTSFAVEDARRLHSELTARGVHFTRPPLEMGRFTAIVLDDTCGNLIQLVSSAP